MKNTKLTALFLSLAMVFCLAACGTDMSDSTYTGNWTCIGYESGGFQMTVDEMGRSSLNLKANGKADVVLMDDSAGCKWAESGSGIVLTEGDVTYTGTMDGDTLVMDFEGISTYFKKDGGMGSGSEASKAAAASSSPAVNTADEARYYTIESAVFDGEPFSKEDFDLMDEDYYLYLKPDGTAELMVDNVMVGSWDDKNINIAIDGEPKTLPYTIDGNKLTLEIEENVLSFALTEGQPDASYVSSGSGFDENSGLGLSSYWSGDWYGWWGIDTASGSYEDMEGDWWDCCANIDVDDDGEGEIDFWDEDYSADDLFGCVYIGVAPNPTGGDMGIATSEGGWFMDGGIDEGDWIIDPSGSDYDNYLEIDGYYEDPDNDENYIYYVIFLRPWGQLWDDVKADNPDGLPYYYDDWYLPLVEAGSSMPETIG